MLAQPKARSLLEACCGAPSVGRRALPLEDQVQVVRHEAVQRDHAFISGSTASESVEEYVNYLGRCEKTISAANAHGERHHYLALIGFARKPMTLFPHCLLR